jgi:hypothetical protein
MGSIVTSSVKTSDQITNNQITNNQITNDNNQTTNDIQYEYNLLRHGINNPIKLHEFEQLILQTNTTNKHIPTILDAINKQILPKTILFSNIKIEDYPPSLSTQQPTCTQSRNETKINNLTTFYQNSPIYNTNIAPLIQLIQNNDLPPLIHTISTNPDIIKLLQLSTILLTSLYYIATIYHKIDIGLYLSTVYDKYYTNHNTMIYEVAFNTGMLHMVEAHEICLVRKNKCIYDTSPCDVTYKKITNKKTNDKKECSPYKMHYIKMLQYITNTLSLSTLYAILWSLEHNQYDFTNYILTHNTIPLHNLSQIYTNALMYAIEQGNMETIQYILQCNPQFDIKAHDNLALAIAILEKRIDVIIYLINIELEYYLNLIVNSGLVNLAKTLNKCDVEYQFLIDNTSNLILDYECNRDVMMK